MPSGGLRTFAALLLGTLVSACDDRPPPVPSSTAVVSARLPAAKSVRFVKLEEVTEWNGGPWGSVAEFNLLDATGAVVDRKPWKASADRATATDAPGNAIDGESASIWHTPWEGIAPVPPHSLTIDLGVVTRVSGFRYLPRQDKSVNGTIAQYRFYVSTDGVNWGEPVSAGDFAGMSGPTAEKTVIFAEQTVNQAPVVAAPAPQTTAMGRPVSVTVVATDADGDRLNYAAEGLPTGLTIAPATGAISGTPIVPGRYKVRVSASDNKAARTNVDFEWSVQAPAALSGEPVKAGEYRFVKLEQVSEVQGRAWAAVAELNLLDAAGATLPRTGWVASADSAEHRDSAGYAIDGVATSLWHTQWDGVAPPPPHSLIVDMGRPAAVRGFRYLPRQDGQTNGTIGKFRFYASADGVDWGSPLAEGDFSTMGAPGAEKTVRLK